MHAALAPMHAAEERVLLLYAVLVTAWVPGELVGDHLRQQAALQHGALKRVLLQYAEQALAQVSLRYAGQVLEQVSLRYAERVLVRAVLQYAEQALVRAVLHYAGQALVWAVLHYAEQALVRAVPQYAGQALVQVLLRCAVRVLVPDVLHYAGRVPEQVSLRFVRRALVRAVLPVAASSCERVARYSVTDVHWDASTARGWARARRVRSLAAAAPVLKLDGEQAPCRQSGGDGLQQPREDDRGSRRRIVPDSWPLAEHE
jgi:hypothetical protein